jgi:hypothetical protein
MFMNSTKNPIFQEILIAKTLNNENIFHFAVQNENEEVFGFLLNKTI